MSGMMVIMLFGSLTCPEWWWFCYLDPQHVLDDGDYAIWIPNMSRMTMMMIMLFGSSTCPGWWWLCYLDPQHVWVDGDYVIWIPNMSGMMVIMLFGLHYCDQQDSQILKFQTFKFVTVIYGPKNHQSFSKKCICSSTYIYRIYRNIIYNYIKIYKQ